MARQAQDRQVASWLGQASNTESQVLENTNDRARHTGRLWHESSSARSQAGKVSPPALVTLLVLALILGTGAFAFVTAGFPGATGDDDSMTGQIPDFLGEDPLEGGSARLTNRGYAIADDDGELHVGWDDTVSYGFEEERYEEDGVIDSEELGLSVMVDAIVEYPKLTDAGEYAGKINAVLRETAMETVDHYLLKPDDDARSQMRTLGTDALSQEYDAVLTSDVTWAISYNTEDFISVTFSDQCAIGTSGNHFILLRCVNANLETGEIYQVDDVLTMNEDIASAFIDALAQNSGTDTDGDGTISDEESDSVAIIGREAFIQALMGKGDYASRVSTTFFVDEDGQVNLGVNYSLSNRSGWVVGWWDAQLSDELLEGARRDSSFWALMAK